MTILVGLAIWVLEMVVAALSARPRSALLGFVVAVLLLPVPAFVTAPPIQRGLLAFAFEICLVRSAQLALRPLRGSFVTRLIYLFSFVAFVDTRAASKSEQRFDARSAVNVVIAAIVATAAFVGWNAALSLPPWLRTTVRFSVGAVMIFAFVEITTEIMRLLTALVGVTLPALHDAPYRARSLSEFWGRRWNIGAAAALRELCFAPLAHRSLTVALFATFAFSAALHAYIGFVALGLQTSLMWGAFFLVQPVLITIERKLRIKRWPRFAGHVWTVLALAMTSPLLVVPFLRFFKLTV